MFPVIVGYLSIPLRWTPLVSFLGHRTILAVSSRRISFTFFVSVARSSHRYPLLPPYVEMRQGFRSSRWFSICLLKRFLNLVEIKKSEPTWRKEDFVLMKLSGKVGCQIGVFGTSFRSHNRLSTAVSSARFMENMSDRESYG